MKIAILTSGILPVPAVQGGAAENLVDYYLEYNDQHQLHDITVFSVYHPDVKKSPALKSHSNHYIYINRHSKWSRLKAKLYGKLHPKEYYHYQLEFFFEQAYKKLRKQHYDLIILENRPGFALKLRKRLNIPIISHIHTDTINSESPQAKALIKANDGFICVSEFIKSRIMSVGLSTKAVVVYNGLDDQKFSNNNHNASISRNRFGFNDKDFIVIYTGRIVPKKGVKELVEAIQLLNNEPSIKLLVVGGDNYGDSVSSNPYLDELHDMGRQMNGKVHFTGFVPYEQLPSYLRLADVVVVPSRINDALPTSCIEATAMGLPVIGTNDGGLPETLIGQKHIIINKDGDLPRQIAKAILIIRDNYINYCGNCISPQFTKNIYAKTFLEKIEEYGI